ncbi:MAG: site-specific tyrosine recombinase XerD [Opitutales bacterium]
MDLTNALQTGLTDYRAYLALEKGLSPATVEGYLEDLGQFAAYLPSARASWADVTHEDAAGWLHHLAIEGYSVGSIARKLSALRTLARFLVSENIRKDDFSQQLQGPRLNRKLPGTLSPGEVDRLLEAPDARTPGGLRDRAMLELMYSSGLRVSELCGLGLTDVDLEAGFVRVFGKGSKERLAPVGSRASAAIARYLEVGRPSLVKPKTGSALFLSGWGRAISRKTFWVNLREHAKRAGIEQPVKPHLLRHSFATHMLLGGADLRVVQEILGHADISTTEIYTHAANPDLADEHALYHPRNRAGQAG